MSRDRGQHLRAVRRPGEGLRACRRAGM